jgi:uncharacterized protein with HEPN domain
MKKDDLIYVGHMLETSRDVVGRVAGIDRDAFDRDDNLRLALTHLVQTIGEAARRVSDEFRASHPEIPWSVIVGMRHKLVHDYIHVDYVLVWETVIKDIPNLVTQLEAIVPE